MHYEKTTNHPVGENQLLDTLTNPDFIVEHAKFYKALDCRVVEVSRSTASLVQKVIKREISKTSGEEEEVVETREWNLARRRCEWTRTPPKGAPPGMVKISGAYQITGDSQSSRLISEGDIDIRIPIMGKKLAQKIIDKIVNDDGKFERFVNDYLKERSG
ncbi:MAG: hypothetical protein Kow0090_15100 [Myxococcota bacterium]